MSNGLSKIMKSRHVASAAVDSVDSTGSSVGRGTTLPGLGESRH